MSFSAYQFDQLQRVCAGEPRVLAAFLFGSQANGIQRVLVEYYDFQPVLETYRREFARSLENDYGL
jgi:hypothetical protein